jgi:hypothetical protein
MSFVIKQTRLANSVCRSKFPATGHALAIIAQLI